MDNVHKVEELSAQIVEWTSHKVKLEHQLECINQLDEEYFNRYSKQDGVHKIQSELYLCIKTLTNLKDMLEELQS